MSTRTIEIVLTGGPCSGKTILLGQVEQLVRTRGLAFHAIEEPATKLIKEKGLKIKEALAAGDIPLIYDCERQITQHCLRCRAEIKKEVKQTGHWTVVVWDRAIP